MGRFTDKIADKIQEKIQEKIEDGIDALGDKLADKAGDALVDKSVQKAINKINAPLKEGKFYISYEIDNPKDHYEPNDVITGKMFLKSTNDSEKKVKFVKVRITETWIYKKSRSELEPRFNFLAEVELDKKSTIGPGEEKTYDFEIKLPDKLTPKNKKKDSDWSVSLNFIKKTGMKANMGSRKITASYPIIVDEVHKSTIKKWNKLVKAGFIKADIGEPTHKEEEEVDLTEELEFEEEISDKTPVKVDLPEVKKPIKDDVPEVKKPIKADIPEVKKPIKLERPKVKQIDEFESKEEKAKELRVISSELTAIEKLEEWIKLDKAFLNYVDKINLIGSDRIKIKFDLTTEGYLEEIGLKILYSDVQGAKYIIKMECQALMDVPYNTNVIMAKTKEGVVATPFSGSVSNENEMIETLKKISDKEKPSDTFSLMLFQNNELKKLISKSLKTKSPDSLHVGDIRVPVIIEQRGNEGCLIRIYTFYDKAFRPIDLFVRIMDTIAGTLDQFLDVKTEEPEEITEEEDKWVGITKPTVAPQFSSKYLKKEEASISNIPTCPHCDRPLPRAQSTDYRRCPYCYEKLD